MEFQKHGDFFIPLTEIVKPTGRLCLDLYNVKTKKHDVQFVDNMFVTIGKQAVARWLQGDTTAGPIKYCAVGTSVVAPALGDTGLTTEIARNTIGQLSFASNVATLLTYFGTSVANGTLREAGMFGDTGANGASATLGSGTLFTKAAINRVKTINDTLTITWTITVG